MKRALNPFYWLSYLDRLYKKEIDEVKAIDSATAESAALAYAGC